MCLLFDPDLIVDEAAGNFQANNYSYAWTFPAGATNPGNVASFSTSIAGLYSVVVTNTTTSCQSLSVPVTVTINPQPTVVVSIVNATICPGQSATVTATPGSIGTYTYAWTVQLEQRILAMWLHFQLQ